MPLTHDLKLTVKARAQADPAFRAALLTEAIGLLLGGEVEIGKLVLRDYINTTIGFRKLAEQVDKPAKSLMRMFSARGNPTADNLFAVIGQLQKVAGIHLAVAAE